MKVALICAGLSCADTASAQVFGSWELGEHSWGDHRVTAVHCVLPLTGTTSSCIMFACGPDQSPRDIGLLVSNIGFATVPFQTEETQLRWTFHDGTTVVLDARQSNGPPYPDITTYEAIGWRTPDIMDPLTTRWADAGPDHSLLITLPDGRSSPFGLEGLVTAIEFAEDSCAQPIVERR